MTAPTTGVPVVPPPNARPTTATQKADLALDRLDDLERTLAAGGAADDSFTPAANDKLHALDTDLDALGKAFNDLASRVEALQPDGLEKLREDIRSTLAELRATGPAQVSVPEVVAKQLERLAETTAAALRKADEAEAGVTGLGNTAQMLREEQGSYSRALDTLLRRVEEVERRPVAVASEVVTLEDGTPRGALRKFLALMNAVDSLGKDKTADAKMGGYAFRSIDAAMDAVGHGMRSVGLIMRSEVIDHIDKKTVIGERVWTSVVARMRYVFVDPDDGSEHAIEMVGEGRDLGDKATSKAVSMALKYGLLQSLCIPFNAPESDGETTPPIEREEPQRQERPAQRQQQETAPEPTDDTPSREDLQASVENEKNAQALRAVQAIDALGQLFPHDQPPRLQAIEKRCRELDIGHVVIRGSTVAQHVLGARATLPTPDGGW
jgi:hypothetical protein